MTINNKYTHFGLSVVAALTAMILVTGTISPAINQAYAATTSDGRTMALSVSSPLGTATFMDTGSLLSSGGTEVDATPITIQTPLATADGLLSVTIGSDQANSQSPIGELVLRP